MCNCQTIAELNRQAPRENKATFCFFYNGMSLNNKKFNIIDSNANFAYYSLRLILDDLVDSDTHTDAYVLSLISSILY